MLGDNETAVGCDFGYGITDITETRHFFNERIIAAAALGAAFDDMSGG